MTSTTRRKCFTCALAGLAMLCAWQGQAQTEAAIESKLRAQGPVNLRALQAAPVVINGEVLFQVVGVSTYPAKRRADEIESKIEAIAEDPDFDPKTLRIVEDKLHHKIFPGEGRGSIVTIFDEDAALEGVARALVADTFRTRIKEAIETYRHERKPEAILSAILHALLRTLLLGVILWGVFWAFRQLNLILETRFKRRVENIEAKSLKIIQAEQLWGLLNGLLRVLRVLIVLVLAYIFVNFVLTLFPWTRYAAEASLDLLLLPLTDMGNAVVDYIPSLIFLILLFFIVRYVLKILRGFFLALSRSNIKLAKFEADWALPTYRIVRTLVIVFAVVLAYPHIPGSDSEAFKGISILAGVLFSLGSSSMISNLIAGYTMTYRRAFRIGDRVKINNTVGDVSEMRLLVTHLRSLKNEEVVIPNSTILNNEVVNYSTLAKKKGLILHTTVGIGYEVPWRQVEAMLLMAAERTPGLLREPKPFVLQTALADFAVNYELNVYIDDEKNTMPLYSELHKSIQDVFNEYGIQIMTPSYEADTADPKIVPKDKWYAEPASPPSPQQA